MSCFFFQYDSFVGVFWKYFFCFLVIIYSLKMDTTTFPSTNLSAPPPSMSIPPPIMNSQMPNLSVPPPGMMPPNPSFQQKFDNRNSFNNRNFFKPFQPFGPRGGPIPLGPMTLEDFDGKRLRKSVMRKTVDYNSSIIKALEVSFENYVTNVT